MHLIPLPETFKTKLDLAAVPGAISLPFLTGFPWAEFAAMLASVYGILRLLEWLTTRAARLVSWLRARKRADK